MKLKRPTTRQLSIAGAGIALLAAIAFIAVRSGPLAATRVTVVRTADASLSPALFGTGTVEARRAWLIGPTAAGRVLRVMVDVGDSVKTGQLLAEMDPVDLQERMAALNATQARAASAITAAEAQVRDATARREIAVANERRYAELRQKDFISPVAAEAKKQELTSADAALSAAQASLAGARQELTRTKADAAALGQQRDNVRLLAPADGVVISRDAEAGSTVVAGQPVLKLADPASLWVKLRLDQGRSGGLAVGLPASIALRSRPARPLAGKVARVELQSDSVTEERIAQISFDAVPTGLSMGELAEVTVALPATASGPVLPNAAIQRQGSKLGVWQLEGGKPVFTPVRLGQSSLDGQVQIAEGLKAGDEVIVYSEKELTAGTRIKVVESLTGRQP
ncbi:MAG: efflux RND transporter periplasmic adaptor subunit [Burkholderiaceae bacterium]|nr:efflux RND transporter periplasmic adaptor subunit [Burkholderiaceae bacterium]